MHLRKSLTFILLAALMCGIVPVSAHAEDTEPDFETMFSGAVILYKDSPNAVADLSDVMIDEGNFAVTPYVKNSRTLAPLRFVGESLGANVNWDQKTSTVTIQGNSRAIKLKLGGTQMTVNGVVKKLDVPAQFSNGRVFVPLRAISEAFGKQVFYDRGVIVINDAVKLDPVKDADMIDYLIFTLKPFHKDPYTGQTLSTESLSSMDQSVVMLESFDRNGQSLGFGTAFSVGYGLFLTNYHVVDQASSYLIITEQDRYYEVEGVVDADPDSDLALVKTVIRTNVPPLHLGSSTGLKKGQSIAAIGNPDGYQNTVSTGIVSGFRQDGNNSLIQISAPITNGSSGGPLLNMKGEVVGVTTMGVQDGASLNFAEPIDEAKALVGSLKSVDFAKIPVLDQSLFQEPASADGSTDGTTDGSAGTGSDSSTTGSTGTDSNNGTAGSTNGSTDTGSNSGAASSTNGSTSTGSATVSDAGSSSSASSVPASEATPAPTAG